MKSAGLGGIGAKASSEPPAPEDGGNPDDLMQRLKEWKEVAHFLRRNVVQGTLDPSGAYSKSEILDRFPSKVLVSISS